MKTIWIVYWIKKLGDSPEINAFGDPQEAQECWLKHCHDTHDCDIQQFQIWI